ncbi:MAG: hypothetical protein Cons2KO_11870 [Congregibacter sp.]
MNRDEAKALLDAYGADAEKWPAERRQALALFLDGDDAAADILKEARQLDQVLATYELPGVDLADQILDALPQSGLERLLNWLMPVPASLWWRPAMAAALPLAIGVCIGALNPEFSAYDDVNDWASVEAQLLSLPAGESAGVSWYE